MAEIVPTFDYGALDDDDAELIRLSADRIRTLHKTTMDSIIAAGRELLDVKKALPHGSFGGWIATEFGWTERTAQSYMNTAERFGSNPEVIADLPAATVYKLAAKSTPDTVRTAVVSKIEAGEKIAAPEVETLIWKAKQEAREAKEAEKKSPQQRARDKAKKEREQAEREKRAAQWEEKAEAEADAIVKAAEIIGGAVSVEDMEILLRHLEAARGCHELIAALRARPVAPVAKAEADQPFRTMTPEQVKAADAAKEDDFDPERDMPAFLKPKAA